MPRVSRNTPPPPPPSGAAAQKAEGHFGAHKVKQLFHKIGELYRAAMAAISFGSERKALEDRTAEEAAARRKVMRKKEEEGGKGQGSQQETSEETSENEEGRK